METLARQIEQGMHGKEWIHSAIYEKDLARLWPLNEKDREAKIAQFATQYGFRLRFYNKGMCAIFDKWPLQRSARFDLISDARGRREGSAGEEARAPFLNSTAEERAELLWIVSESGGAT